MSPSRTATPSHSGSITTDVETVRHGSFRLLIALLWLGFFSSWFYRFGLPNNAPAERWMIWQLILFDLLDLIDPPPAEPPAAPWSWFNLGQRLPFVGVACLIWVAATCVGRLQLRGLRLFRLFEVAERLFFAGCLGLSTLSLGILALGLLGWLSRWPLLALLLLAILPECYLSWRDRQSATKVTTRSSVPVNQSDRFNWLPWIVGGLVIPFALCMLLGAMSPQTDFDVIEYHLGGPKEWYQQGQIARLPHNVYTSFPFLTEMLLLSGMVLFGDWDWGALAGQAIIAGFAPLAAIGLYATGRHWFSAKAGWFAVLIWLTTPWVYRISIIAYAEGGLACYLLAAFAVGLRIIWIGDTASISADASRQEPASAASTPISLFGLCGFFAGGAMACKYTGLISAVIPVGCLLAWYSIRQTQPAGRWKQFSLRGVVFAAGVLIAVGPWLLKNAIETGNPVFPLAYSIFGGEGRDAAMNAQWQRGHSSHYASLSDWIWDWPVKLTDVVANNDWHSVLMFAFAPIALLAGWRKKVWLVWAFIGWQFLAWFLFTHHIDRFYVPMFPAVALLAGCGASWLWQFAAGRWCGGALVIASVAFNIWIMHHIGGFNAGRLDLHDANDLVISPSQRWLNKEYASGRLPKDFKVLCVGEAALFHAKFPYVYNTVFDRSIFEECFAERSDSGELRLRSPEDSRERLRQRGITHVLVNWSEILRYREPGSYGYTEFAHPDWFAKLQSAGVLGSALPIPDAALFAPVNESRQKQVAEWAPSLAVSMADRPGIRAVQIFPIRL